MNKSKKVLIIIVTILFSLILFACGNNNADKDNKKIESSGEIDSSSEINENEKEKQKQEKVKVYLGIDRIDEYLDFFEGKRVGLITNATGLNSEYKSTIDVLFEKINLVALFAPEHGIRGAADAGESFGNDRDPVTNLTIYSLFGSTVYPTKEMMDLVDVMCIDIQDVGSRFYTYVYTMSRAMETCAMYGKEFVVFDRPNPISGKAYEGNILNMNFSSGIGLYPIIQRHGLTIGEIAKLFNEEYHINCNLKVIEMKDWTRNLYIDETTVPWVLPSPNMPTVDTALVYPGTCIFEGSNLSEGRGTTRPFELIGAPYIDSIALAEALNNMNLEGVYFRPAAFTPNASKWQGQTCYGVQVHVTDRDKFEAVKVGWTMLYVVREMYPDKFDYTNTFNLLTGCDYFKKGTYNLDELCNILKEDTKTFSSVRDKYIIYK